MRLAHMTLILETHGCLASSALLIERALGKIAGVVRVYVNPATEMAYVTYDPGQCQMPRLIAAAHQAGFDVTCACDTAPQEARGA